MTFRSWVVDNSGRSAKKKNREKKKTGRRVGKCKIEKVKIQLT
jgi:hypothetical protein